MLPSLLARRTGSHDVEAQRGRAWTGLGTKDGSTGVDPRDDRPRPLAWYVVPDEDGAIGRLQAEDRGCRGGVGAAAVVRL